jgi:hypothetical protein
MLSDSVIRKINDQIEADLRVLPSNWSSAESKATALDRIAQMKALLNPQPSRTDILSELAEAIVEVQRNSNRTSTNDLISDLVAAFRR